MSQVHTVIVCASGTKWTGPLYSGSPDPCPDGQRTSAVSLTTLNDQELVRLGEAEARISAIESSMSSPSLPPSSEQIALAFSTAFSTVLLCFLVARGVGTVLNFIRHG